MCAAGQGRAKPSKKQTAVGIHSGFFVNMKVLRKKEQKIVDFHQKVCYTVKLNQ